MRLFKNPLRNPWFGVVIGATVGGVASFLQVIERIKWAAQPDTPLACDINNAFSCSNVFGAWQSSVFGFSNAILCLTFFAVMLGFGLAGLYADRLQKTIRLIMHFFALFFLAFGAWYLQQTAFVVGYLCIYCVSCYAGVILINWGYLRLNAEDLPLSHKLRSKLMAHIKKGNDSFIWVLYALGFFAMFAFKFWA